MHTAEENLIILKIEASVCSDMESSVMQYEKMNKIKSQNTMCGLSLLDETEAAKLKYGCMYCV